MKYTLQNTTLFLGILCLSLFAQHELSAQAGQVQSHQEITSMTGGLTFDLQPSELLGFSLAPLGDIDGDGVPDIATGAPQYDGIGSDEGAVYVLFLNPNGTVKSHQRIAENEGGFAELLETADILGTDVDGLGDFDGDGTNDMVMGAARVEAANGDPRAGAIFVTLLNPNGSVKSTVRIADGVGGLPAGTLVTDDWWGYGVTNMGDLDSDGNTDLAVGTLLGDFLTIVFLNSNGTVKSTQRIGNGQGGFTGTIVAGSEFSSNLDNIGDLDGDGVNDLAVGNSEDNSIWILFMNSNGTVKFHQKIGSGLGGFTGFLEAGDEFGRAVSATTDIDGDGITEIMVGARYDDDGGTNRGAVWLLFMNSIGSVKYHQKISDTSGGFSAVMDDSYEFGASASPIGDLNGDGKWEQAVGGRGNEGDGNIQILYMRTDVTLPVELISFDALVNGNTVKLEWQTASEENNSGFEVDAYNSSTDLWETMSFIDGAGTTESLSNYSYEVTDHLEIYTKFRLKQIDYDGAVSIGNEVEIVRDLPGPFVLSDAYPNPFNPTTNFTLSLAVEQAVQIDLFDSLGRHVSNVHSGLLTANTVHNFQINAEGLPGGNYFYRVSADQFETSKRVVLLK